MAAGFRRLACALILIAVAFGSARGDGMVSILKTADTTLVLEADEHAPRIVSLESGDGERWKNSTDEPLVDLSVIEGKSVPHPWKLNALASRATKKEVTFVYECAEPALRLAWSWQARAGYGPLEHEITIENHSPREIGLPLQQKSFLFAWQVDPALPLEHVFIDKGAGSPTAVGTHEVAVADRYAWSGASSTYANDGQNEIIPWEFVGHPGSKAGGWYVGIESSACVRLYLGRIGDTLWGGAGLDLPPGPFVTRLKPGESFTTPPIFLGAAPGSLDDAGNTLRRWVRDVLGNPGTWAQSDFPRLDNDSWGSGMDIDEARADRMIRDDVSLGLEMFHIDAGWFRGVGDWYPDAKKFPHGMAPIADEAHEHGLKFGLWCDWTQAGTDTAAGALNVGDPVVHDWLTANVSSDWKPEAFKGITIDLGVPAAQAWARRETNRIVSDYHLDLLEHDGYLVAKTCVRDDHPHTASSADISYHAVQAYYEIQSALRRDHPGLLLEICNDGGRMVDFGSAAHGDYFSITDTYDPLSNRRAFYDASHVLPPAMLECYVDNWPAPHLENFLYALRSGMMGWLTVMQDTTSWTPGQHAAAKAEFALYRSKLRPLIRDADLYHISARPDGVHWDGVEYFDPVRKSGVVYAFRGSTGSEGRHAFVLHGLRGNARYQIHFNDQTAPDAIGSGSDLMSHGLEVELPLPNSSEIVFIDENSAR